MLSIFLLVYKYILCIKPKIYYYYDGIDVIDVSLIIFCLDLLLVGEYLKKKKYGNKLYYIKNNKLMNYYEGTSKSLYCKKIIKSIEYNDLNYKYDLNIIKENIFNIHENVPLQMLLILYKKIKLRDSSKLHIKYFMGVDKNIKILSTTKFDDILN